MTNILKTKLKFKRLASSGLLTSFVSADKSNGYLYGVRENDPKPKKIVLVDKSLSSTLSEDVLYMVEMTPMASGNGYVVVRAKTMQFPATLRVNYVPRAVYSIEINFGNRTLKFNPLDGRKDTVCNFTKCRQYLSKQQDIKNLDKVLSDFTKAGKSLLARMEADGICR